MHLLNYTHAEFCRRFKADFGRGAFHATALYRQMFQQGHLSPENLPEFQASPVLAEKVRAKWALLLNPVVAEQSEDHLIKYVTRLSDGCTIESVIVPMTRYTTLCVSSQVGCRMGCIFCRTGQQGWQRNLSAAEIVAQIITARQLFNSPVRNIVFMGMGEPLDNLDNVIQAIRIMTEPHGLNIPHSHITVSTVGWPAGLQQLAALNWPRLNLAISLNAVDYLLRGYLMPATTRVPPDVLQQTLIDYPLKKSGVFLISYILFEGINDTPARARELVAWLRPLPVRVNLITCNSEAGMPLRPSPPAVVEQFRRELVSHGVFVRRRRIRGQSIKAACGQLVQGLKG